MLIALEWFGALTGIAGSIMIALNNSVSRYAFPVWIASNVALVALYSILWMPGVLLMQSVYLATSLLGVWRWFRQRPPALSAQDTARDAP